MRAATSHHLTASEIARRDRELSLGEAANPAGWLKAGVLSANGVAIAGEDGWMFIADGANQWERQYAGAAPPDPWLETWATVMTARQAEAARRGVALWNLIIPEKQVIYPEKRWPNGAPDSSRRPLRQLEARLGEEARLIYGEAALSRCKAQVGPAYAERDSHWTASGCVSVVDDVVRRIAPSLDATSLRFAVETFNGRRDLAHHFFDRGPGETFLVLRGAGDRTFDNRQYERTGRHAGSAYVERNAAAPDPRPVVVFGDSFSYDAGFVGGLTAAFADVAFVWSKSVDWAVVEQRKAQVVIWESAERFLLTTPQS